MTFFGLLNKSLKQHAATTNSAAAAAAAGVHATKPGAATNTTNTTTASITSTQEYTTHTQGAVMASPKTDSAPTPDPAPALSMTPQPSLTASIDPTVLSIDPHSPSSQPQMLSSPLSNQSTVPKLDLKQPVAPTPLSPPSTTPSSPAAPTGTTTITTTKKKQQQQQQLNLSAAQSASYRKRLNVNQVCDWCRYRKIRCDREAPCNSCQHSKRECIRTPPEVLLSKLNKEAENSSTEPMSTTVTKRSSTADDEQDGQSSLKAKKVARSNSIAPSSSHISIEHSTASTFSSAVGPLSLNLPSTMAMSLCGEQQQQPMTMLSSGIQGTQSSLQDQEHLERMRRIEMLLSNVIPGAAEFIAHGRQRRNSFSPPSNEQQGQQHQQQHVLSSVSPAMTAAGSPLGLTLMQDDSSSLSLMQEGHGASLGREGQQQQQQEGQHPSVFTGQDYIERMKRIELLLGSVQDKNSIVPVVKPSLAVPTLTANTDTISKTMDNADDTKKDTTTTVRKNKATGTKKVARNSDGTIIKRPHVAAGFAGQKPPPKLPQAIAEAALKKLAGKKKKRSSAPASSAASVVATTTTIAVTPVMAVALSATMPSAAPAVAVTIEGTPASPVSTITVTAPAQNPSAPQAKTKTSTTAVTLSSPKSFDIPATIDHHQISEKSLQLSHSQQQLQHQRQQKNRAQILARQQQQRRPGRLNTQLHSSISYHHQHKQQQHGPYTPSTQSSVSYVGGVGHMTNIGSISIPTIPLSNAMASYESLVVPACNSAESSPASSPKATTTTIGFPSISSSASVPGSTSPLTPMDFLAYGTPSGFPTMHNGVVGGAGGANFSMTLNMIHPAAGTTDQIASPIDGPANNQAFLPCAPHGAAPMYNPHHPLHQHNHHQAMHIPQDTVPLPTSLSGMQDFAGGATALQMAESLESWMNSPLVPSLDVFSTTSTIPALHTTSSFLAGGGFGQPQQQMHRPYQHQQSFYIPQMHDDEEEEDEEESHTNPLVPCS